MNRIKTEIKIMIKIIGIKVAKTAFPFDIL